MRIGPIIRIDSTNHFETPLTAIKTEWNNHRPSLLIAIDALEPGIKKETVTIQRETGNSDFAA